MFNSQKKRIIIPIIGVLILMIGFIAAYVSMSTSSLLDNFTNAKMSATAQAVRAHLELHERQTFIAASAMAGSPELIRRINEGDIEEIWLYTANRKEALMAEAIVITNHEGIVLARSHMQGFYGDDASRVPSVAAGLRGESRTLYTPTPTSPMVMATSAPIMDGGRLIGSVVVNFNVGNDFLDKLNSIFGVDVTIFAGDTSVASTLIHPATGQRAVGTAVAPNVAVAVLERGESLTMELNIFGVLPYLAYFFPLHGAGSEPAGMFFLGLPLEGTIAASNAQQLNIIIIGIFFLVIVTLVMFYVVHTISKPLENNRPN